MWIAIGLGISFILGVGPFGFLLFAFGIEDQQDDTLSDNPPPQ
jgi:hypothetical protein